MKKTLAALALAAAVTSTSHAAVAITEVAPWGSGGTPYAADWFELTNTGTGALTISGWKMDDDSSASNTAVALNGITTIAAGESVIFMETSSSSTINTFKSTWGLGANVQVGSYSGSGVGLSTGGDAVAIFNAAGDLQAKVTFGSSTTGRSFDNPSAASIAALTVLSQTGVNGAFNAPGDSTEVGTPGFSAVPEPATAIFGLGLVGVAMMSRRRTVALA